MRRHLWTGEDGMAIMPVVITLVVISAFGISMVGVMTTDITHASIQRGVSGSHFIAQAGLQSAIVGLKADPNLRTAAYPAAVGATAFGGGQYQVWMEDFGEDLVQVTARGQIVAGVGRVISEVRAVVLVGPPVIFGLFGVSQVSAQGANSRTYLAPWRPAGPGVPRGPNMGSFQDIHFQDAGIRLNALSETSAETVTLRDGTVNDWELFGFASRPSYDPNEPTPWILPVFGDIIKAQPDTGGMAHSCSPPTTYACLTVQNSTDDVQSIYELREDENLEHVYMSRIRQRTLPVATLDSAPLLAAAQANTANAALNTAAGIAHGHAEYTADEFHCLLAHLEANPDLHPAGTIFVHGDTQIGGNLQIACNGGSAHPTQLAGALVIDDGTLVVEGDLTLTNNSTLTIQHDILNADPAVASAARQKAALAVFGGGSSPGRFIMEGGANQRFVADGLVYTADGMDLGSQASVDLIGAMYHSSVARARPSFNNSNGTVVIRFDPLATTLLGSASGVGVQILSWQQLR